MINLLEKNFIYTFNEKDKRSFSSTIYNKIGNVISKNRLNSLINKLVNKIRKVKKEENIATIKQNLFSEIKVKSNILELLEKRVYNFLEDYK